MKYTILKCNTTGLEPTTDKITEIALLSCEDDKVIDEYRSLVNPHLSLSEEVTRISGITNEMLQEAPSFDAIKEKVIEIIGNNPIMGHNIAFDLAFLNASLDNPLSNTTLDTLRIAKAILRSPEDVLNYRFKTICNFYNINDVTHVGAMHTAHLTHLLFERMLPALIEKKRKLDILNG